jgi:hypothetical protein
MNGTHWGAIAIGVGGIATAAALFVSLILLRMQVGEQRRVRADRHREHASCVALWLEPAAVAGPGIVEIRAHMSNTSNRPAMNVRVNVGLELEIWEEASREDGEDYRDVVGEWTAAAIGPASQIDRVVKLEGLPASVTRSVEQYQVPCGIGELAFTDDSGFQWIRTARGELFERGSRQWADVWPMSIAERDDMLTYGIMKRPVPGLRGRLGGRITRRMMRPTTSRVQWLLLALVSRRLNYVSRRDWRRYTTRFRQPDQPR